MRAPRLSRPAARPFTSTSRSSHTPPLLSSPLAFPARTGNKPPAVHEPPPSEPESTPAPPPQLPDDTPATAAHGPAQGLLAHTHASQIAEPHDPDGRPPSIHLSEYAYVEAAASATAASLSSPEDPSPITPSDPQPAMPVPVRARRTTLDLPGSPYDDDPKASPTSSMATSPKPCIVPGNALHLIDDDPAAPRSATPPSVIVVGDESEYGAEPPSSDSDADGDGEHAGAPRAVRPAPRVRFRSRVRITSGVHRHRHSQSAIGGGTSTPGSSTSESPSSSISAPLRYQADDDAAWGPIGKRLSAYAWQRRAQSMPGPGPGGLVQGQGPVQGPRPGMVRNGTMTRSGMRSVRGRGSERTPLLRAQLRQVYGESEDEEGQGMGQEERALREAALRREEEVMFGRWPWRVFNRHVSPSIFRNLCVAQCAIVVVVAYGTRIVLLLC